MSLLSAMITVVTENKTTITTTEYRTIVQPVPWPDMNGLGLVLLVVFLGAGIAVLIILLMQTLKWLGPDGRKFFRYKGELGVEADPSAKHEIYRMKREGPLHVVSDGPLKDEFILPGDDAAFVKEDSPIVYFVSGWPTRAVTNIDTIEYGDAVSGERPSLLGRFRHRGDMPVRPPKRPKNAEELLVTYIEDRVATPLYPQFPTEKEYLEARNSEWKEEQAKDSDAAAAAGEQTGQVTASLAPVDTWKADYRVAYQAELTAKDAWSKFIANWTSRLQKYKEGSLKGQERIKFFWEIASVMESDAAPPDWLFAYVRGRVIDIRKSARWLVSRLSGSQLRTFANIEEAKAREQSKGDLTKLVYVGFALILVAVAALIITRI
jgi:hypothetical protein